MSPETQRMRRVASTVAAELGRLLAEEVQDPRVVGVAISEVRMSGDLQIASVYYIVHGGARERRRAAEGLRHVSGFLRRELGRRLRLRTTPELRLFFDTRFDEAERMENLLDSLEKENDDS